MKKRILSLALVVVMVALVAAGSMAYFTDTDSVSNVYETGDVDIEIVEKRVSDGKVVELTSENMGTLLPGVDEGYNKMVYTVNNGDSDAYIRTFVAVESKVPAEGEEEYEGIYIGYSEETNQYSNSDKLRHGVQLAEKYDHVEIGDRTFTIFVFDTLKKEAVKAGDEVLSVCKVELTSLFTNEDADYFKNVEVYTVSEAIQAAGFNSYDAAMAKLGTLSETYAAALFEGVISENNQ